MCAYAVPSSWSTYAPNHVIELLHRDFLFPDSGLSLQFGNLELVLELLDRAVLVLLAIQEARQYRDEVFDLLLLRNQVASELELRGVEVVRRVRVNYSPNGRRVSLFQISS